MKHYNMIKPLSNKILKEKSGYQKQRNNDKKSEK